MAAADGLAAALRRERAVLRGSSLSPAAVVPMALSISACLLVSSMLLPAPETCGVLQPGWADDTAGKPTVAQFADQLTS